MKKYIVLRKIKKSMLNKIYSFYKKEIVLSEIHAPLKNICSTKKVSRHVTKIIYLIKNIYFNLKSFQIEHTRLKHVK